MRTIKRVGAIAVLGGVLLVGMYGCQVEPNYAVCRDAEKYIAAIENVQHEDAAFKQELIVDVQEYAANPGFCPGYEGMAEED